MHIQIFDLFTYWSYDGPHGWGEEGVDGVGDHIVGPPLAQATLDAAGAKFALKRHRNNIKIICLLFGWAIIDKANVNRK